jgi:hypothetical protein
MSVLSYLPVGVIATDGHDLLDRHVSCLHSRDREERLGVGERVDT